METKIKEKVELGVGAPCGLYCGNCPMGQNGKGPHACCTRDYCPSHLESSVCEIYQCSVVQRGLTDCSACPEFPCDMLLRFSHDSQHPERVSAILNLQRRKALGVNRWLVEERLFWQQRDNSMQWDSIRRMLMKNRRYYAEIRARVLELTEEVEMATLYHNMGTLPQHVGTQA